MEGYTGHERDRYPPKGRGSNYERLMWCRRCDEETLHLFDHGLDRHICSECELE